MSQTVIKLLVWQLLGFFSVKSGKEDIEKIKEKMKKTKEEDDQRRNDLIGRSSEKDAVVIPVGKVCSIILHAVHELLPENPPTEGFWENDSLCRISIISIFTAPEGYWKGKIQININVVGLVLYRSVVNFLTPLNGSLVIKEYRCKLSSIFIIILLIFYSCQVRSLSIETDTVDMSANHRQAFKQPRSASTTYIERFVGLLVCRFCFLILGFSAGRICTDSGYVYDWVHSIYFHCLGYFFY